MCINQCFSVMSVHTDDTCTHPTKSKGEGKKRGGGGIRFFTSRLISFLLLCLFCDNFSTLPSARFIGWFPTPSTYRVRLPTSISLCALPYAYMIRVSIDLADQGEHKQLGVCVSVYVIRDRRVRDMISHIKIISHTQIRW